MDFEESIKEFYRTWCNNLDIDSCDKPGLFWEAFTHSSSSLDNNECLEFLGDGVSKMFIKKWLYDQVDESGPKYDPGQMSSIERIYDNNRFIARFLKTNQLDFVEIMAKGPGFQKLGDKQFKLAANCFEAVLGALSLNDRRKELEDFMMKILIESESDLLESFRGLSKGEANDYADRLNKAVKENLMFELNSVKRRL